MNNKKKYFVRLMCLFLAGLMVISLAVPVISQLFL